MSDSSNIKTIIQRLQESYVTIYACILATLLHFVSDAFFVYWFGRGLLFGFNPIFLLAHAVMIGGIIGISANYNQRHDYSLKTALQQVTGLELGCFAFLLGLKILLLTGAFPMLALGMTGLALFWVSYRYFLRSKQHLNLDQCLLAATCIAVMGMGFGYGCQLGFGMMLGFGISPLSLGLLVFVAWLILDMLGLARFSFNQQISFGFGLFVAATMLVTIVFCALPYTLFFALPAIGFYVYTSWCQHQFKSLELTTPSADSMRAAGLKPGESDQITLENGISSYPEMGDEFSIMPKIK